MKKKLVLVGGVFLVVLGLAVKWWFATPKQHVQYLTTMVVERDIESSVLAVGTLRAADLVSVGAQVSGQIKSLAVHLGQRVTKGQLVAEIDAVPQINALHTAEANLASLHAQWQAGEATLEEAKLTLSRQQTMYAHDASAQQDLEAAQAAYDVARGNLASLTAQITAARIGVDTARVTVGYTRIVAPTDGVVVAVLAVQGQTVNANQTTPNLVMIANLDTITVKALISEADIIKVRPGQRAYFTILGDPDTRYETTLRAIEPAPDSIVNSSNTSTASTSPSTTSTAVYYNGLMDVPNPGGRLRISMTAQVHVVVAEAKHVLAVPSAAIHRGSGKHMSVQILDAQGQVQTRQIEAGLDDGTFTQISGLKAGDRVVTGVGTSIGDHPPSPFE